MYKKLKRRKYKEIDDKKKNNILRDYQSGLSTPKLVSKYDVSQTKALSILDENGIKRRDTHQRRIYYVNENYFKSIDSHNKAQILGFLYADGYNDPQMGLTRITIADIDIEYLFFIKNEMEYSGEIKKIIRPNENHQNLVTLNFYNKQITNDLFKLGCIPNKSLIVEFPNKYILKDEYLPSFLLGVFEGDGCICETGHNRFLVSICGSKSFILEMSEQIYKSIGVQGQLYPYQKIYRWTITHSKFILKFLNWIYSNSKFRMERKHLLFQKFLKIHEERLKIRDFRQNRRKNIFEDFSNGLDFDTMVEKYRMSYSHLCAIRRKWKTDKNNYIISYK